MATVNAHRPTLRSRLVALGPMPLLAALVVVDLLLAGISLVRLVLVGESLTDPWLLETDGGWSEWFGYAQQAALAALLLTLAYVCRRAIWVAYAAIFLCALADDSLRLHENYGSWIADRLIVRLGFPEHVAGLRLNDLGEMFVWGVLALAPVAAAVLLHRRSDAGTRRASRGLAVLIAVYLFFGAVVDQVHVLVLDSWAGDIVGTLEDGGELVALSLAVVYVVGLHSTARLRRAAPPAVPLAGAPEASPVA